MQYTASTLGQLRDAVTALIGQVGLNAPVGNYEDANEIEPTGITDYVLFEWVCINQEGHIVGLESKDYEMWLRPGEVNAIAIRCGANNALNRFNQIQRGGPLGRQSVIEDLCHI